MPEHIAELRRMQTRLMEKGYKVDDEEFKSVLVMSLPNSWENFTTSYQGTRSSSTSISVAWTQRTMDTINRFTPNLVLVVAKRGR
jgi:hypothetical protein